MPGANWRSEGDNVSLSTIDDKLELAQNMSQLLIVAASTILAADADQIVAANENKRGRFPVRGLGRTMARPTVYGVASHHQPIVHLNSDGFEHRRERPGRVHRDATTGFQSGRIWRCRFFRA